MVHVIFCDGACGDAVGRVGGEVFVFVEEAFLRDGGHGCGGVLGVVGEESGFSYGLQWGNCNGEVDDVAEIPRRWGEATLVYGRVQVGFQEQTNNKMERSF